MIYTCTLNPSIDYIVQVSDFMYGELNRGERTDYYPGGKGINVSRVLKRLEIDNTALGFLGDFTGDFIKSFLLKEKIRTDFIEVNGTTRINVKLKSNQETEINGAGPNISDKDLQQLFDQIRQLQPNDILVVAGSIPASVPNDFYVKIAEICTENKVKMIADTSSQALKELLGTKLFLVKPNQHELGELFDVRIDSIENAVYYGKQLQQQGAENVIVSMGGDGAVYISDNNCFIAKAPKGKVINTVGAGDSMVAGFLTAYNKGLEQDDIFRYAVATGSATAFQADLCEKKNVETLLQLVELKKAEF
ncbi:1-phosphofructokinase [Natronobacillus azotifigens]|uniref:Tagatose-6-phosphate kinase n=1 Tax=Natronobacillus azotifigens TaxID=472978 RepID=A0A9J6R8T0_9BACI|nr:1-phosphofructokinase [Natronobacillus azotifigens]MCZ0702029.1 1-phosphofructokinase [Natronobacillus azotifigens]